MNNYKTKLILSLTAVFAATAAFFYSPSTMIEGMRKGLSICGSTVIPSLFPFTVLADYLISSGLSDRIGRAASLPVKRIFHLPGCCACVIITGLFAGFPVGAKMTQQLRESGRISEKEGRRILLLCVNGGPAFVISSVGVSMLSSFRAGVILYASLCLASLIIGILSGLFSRTPVTAEADTKKIAVGTLTESVSRATETMLNICAWILLFMCVSSYFRLLPLPKEVKDIIAMIGEVTDGCMIASARYPSFVLAAVCGWSGLSVHCQVMSALKSVKMNIFIFWLGRIANAALAGLIAFVLFRLFPCETQVFSTASDVLAKPYSVSVPASAAMLIMGAFAIMDLHGRKKCDTI
ncbi:MAG: hypothetical protein PUB20_02520 [Clostridia bacterium]|nr:hypothetical protein [Clostridia bacterium]